MNDSPDEIKALAKAHAEDALDSLERLEGDLEDLGRPEVFFNVRRLVRKLRELNATLSQEMEDKP